MAVHGARRGFGMILHAEYGLAFDADAAIGSVEQRDVGFLHALGQRFTVHGEAVVHGNDFNLAGFQVFHRMIGAMMALGHLAGIGAKCEAQHLMAEANSEHRQAAIDERADGGNGVRARGRGIAGAVR